MIRRPPRSTLFPLHDALPICIRPRRCPFPLVHGCNARIGSGRSHSDLSPGEGTTLAALVRSEEHTSELQSQSNLVCRLLLEKKKTQRKLTNDTRLLNSNCYSH